MDRLLLWIGLLVGLLATVTSLARDFRRRTAALPWGVALLAFVPLLAAAAISLLSQPPFSSGQTLGVGLVLGAAVTLAGALASVDHTADDRRAADGPAAWSARFGAATAGLSAILLLYSGRPLDVLMGYAFGAILFALFFSAGSRRLAGEDGQPLSAGGEGMALLVSSLAAAAYLATFHRSPLGVREWQPLPGLFTATAALLLAARAPLAAPASRGGWLDLGIVAVPLVVVSGLIAGPLNGTWPFLWVVLAGLVISAALGWLERNQIAAADVPASPAAGGIEPLLIGALLVLGGTVIAFRELHGFGIALLVLSGWVSYALFRQEGPPRTVTGVHTAGLVLGLVVVLYRLFTERNDYTRGFQPDFHYYYVSLILGALLPSTFSGIVIPAGPQSRAATATTSAAGERSDYPALLRGILVGAAAVLTPLITWMLVGDRPEAALVLGLALAVLWPVTRGVPAEAARVRNLVAPLMAMGAIQFTHLLAPLALRTRAQRLEILGGVTLAIVLGFCAAYWLERRSQARIAR